MGLSCKRWASACAFFAFGVLCLPFMSSAQSADQTAGTQEDRARRFYLLFDNDIPPYWRSPVKVGFHDESGNSSNVLEKAKLFVEFYAMASASELILSGNDETSTSDDYSFGLVVADFTPKGEFMDPGLRQRLEGLWPNTPLFEALHQRESRLSIGNARDGDDCLIFASGSHIEGKNSRFEVNSVVILAHTRLSEDQRLLCFKNKTALAFGLFTALFDYEKNLDEIKLRETYYSSFPLFLEISGTCRKFEFDHVLACIQRTFEIRYSWMLDFLKVNH